MIVESTENIKCDICQKKIIQKNMDENHCASLVFHKFIPGEEGGYIDKEVSDFCRDCYVKIKAYVVSIGGIIPSFYLDMDNSDAVKEEVQDDRLH